MVYFGFIERWLKESLRVAKRQGSSSTGARSRASLRTDLDSVRVPSNRSSSPSSPASRVIPSANAGPASPAISRVDCQSELGELLVRLPQRWRCRHEWQHQIGIEVLEQSSVMDGENFRRISRQDLERMANAYDRYFFEGLCLPLARSFGMSFRLSSRMSRAGGKTTRRIYRAHRGRAPAIHYEIALSTSLLFQSFRKPGDTTRVCGLNCNNRLAAMQRIVEHELIHLSEMLVWFHSDCAASRFQTITHRMFGHTEHRHELVTQQERAAREFNIRPGKRVAFQIQGKRMVGIVNRITSRATVLVPDSRGPRYNDGMHYAKYYVPLDKLRLLD